MYEDDEANENENEEAEAEENEGGEEAGEDGHEDGEADPVEVLAKEMGWSDADNWKGDPEKHVDAKTFIKNGPEILKTTLRKQDETAAETNAELKEMRESIDEFAKFNHGQEQRAYDKALADIKAGQRQAVEDGDTDAYDAAEKNIVDLEKTKPVEKPEKDDKAKSDAAAEADLKEFMADNSWYGADGDVEASAYAESIASVVGARYQGKAFYEKLSDEVKKKFPKKFSNPNRSKTSNVEGGGEEARKSGDETYASLPAEDKKQCDKFIKQGFYVGDDGKPLSQDKARAKYTAVYYA